MKWMVMCAVDLTAKNRNRETCFDRNATDLATESEAQAEANRRNAAEKAAGHTNVQWYACEQMDFSSFLRRKA